MIPPIIIAAGAKLVEWCFDRECWKPILDRFRPKREIRASADEKTFTPGKPKE